MEKEIKKIWEFFIRPSELELNGIEKFICNHRKLLFIYEKIGDFLYAKITYPRYLKKRNKEI